MHYFGPFRLDSERLLLSVGKRPLPLGPKVVQTLLAFVERPGEVLTKSELLDRVWPGVFVEESNLAQNVYVLRKVLRAYWNDVIETVPRRGYRFAAGVSTAAPRTAGSRFYYAAAAATFALALSFGLLHDTARSRPVPQHLSSTGARLFAVGTYYWKQRTQESVQKSIRYFGAVIKSDPMNARGYAALAQTYAIEGDYGYGPFKRSYARARALAHRALKLDAQLAEAHAALGIAEDVPATRAAAREQYREALALDPNYASAHQWYGSALLAQGRRREAIAELQKALQLDPVSVATLAWLSSASYLSRQYPAAIAYAREAAELSPQRRDTYFSMGLGYEAIGNYRAAIAAYRAYSARCGGCPGEIAALLAHAYARSGNFRAAAAQLALAMRKSRMDAADPGDLAVALIALNRRSDALATLKRVAPKDAVRFALDPRFDPVRGDPRFKKYLKLPA
jgi:DNA-binding winged helix-turn-helix (wHTH) protein/predicted TPR repeat methyltransferase